jgi:hypothetical protein
MDGLHYVGITAGVGLATSYASRAFALDVLKQGDVTPKSPGTQLEDALGAGAAAALAGFLAHPRPHSAFWAGIPVATLAYASIAEIPALRTSLANPTTPLLVIGGILASVILATFGWSAYSMPEQRTVAIVGALVFIGWIGSYWIQRHLDKDGTVHIHHWMLGVGLVMMFGAFSNAGHLPSSVLVTIGIGLIIHAASVYRITSGACGTASNCRRKR